MFHFRKNLANFTQDYGVQESVGIPALADVVVPVTLVDDTREFLTRTRAIYHVNDTQAAVAAVYSYAGFLAGDYAVRFKSVFAEDPGAAVVAHGGMFTADLRTANQGSGTVGGLARQLPLQTTTLITGTSTVDGARAGMVRIRDSALPDPIPYKFEGIILRPGEYLWIALDTVNIALTINAVFEELAFAMQINPPTLL